MSKIKINNVFQDEVRAIIPLKNNDGLDEYIIVKNPSKKLKEDIMNKIWIGIEQPELKVSDIDLLQILIDELVNIELDIPLDELLEGNISYELQCVLYNIGKISQELTSEVFMNSELTFMRIKNKELSKRVHEKTEELEKMKNIKK